MNKTLDECFRELISQKGWYKNSPYDRKKASEDKKRFEAGKLPDSLKREYLQAAGYECVQPELWVNMNNPYIIDTFKKDKRIDFGKIPYYPNSSTKDSEKDH